MADYFADDDILLQNKLGISDIAKLHEVEQDIVVKATAKLLYEKLPTDFDFECLKHIHKVLFEDIYDFAGQIRTVDITKPDSKVPFAYARFLAPESDRIFGELKKKSYLANLPKEKFIKEISSLVAELNALHPFREGNGRTIRLFLILLADKAGYLLDYSQVSSEELINADIQAFQGNDALLQAVYNRVVA